MSNPALRSRRRDTPDLNITSLIDVVLLLLVFFMLSTTFNRPTELQVQLPKASAKASTKQNTVIDISIDAKERFFVDKQEINDASMENLAQILKETAQGREQLTVQINADAHTPHQAVVTAMDAARHAGLLRIAFIAIQELTP